MEGPSRASRGNGGPIQIKWLDRHHLSRWSSANHHVQGGFLRAKLLLRFLGELLNCGLVQAQEYGDMLTTLCASFVSTEHLHVKQPCRDIVTYMVLSAVLRVGPSLSKARIVAMLFARLVEVEVDFQYSCGVLAVTCADGSKSLSRVSVRHHAVYASTIDTNDNGLLCSTSLLATF